MIQLPILPDLTENKRFLAVDMKDMVGEDMTLYEKKLYEMGMYATDDEVFGALANDAATKMNSMRREYQLEAAKQMPLFDTRLYRYLSSWDGLATNVTPDENSKFYPFFDYGSYVSDWHETIASIDLAIAEAEDLQNPEEKKKTIESLESQREYIANFVNDYDNMSNFLAQRSLVHPYALVKIAGASGNKETVQGVYTHDAFYKRRFYEIDGENGYSGHYAKNPTTTTLINWGNASERGKTPYSFQDFLFCKWWNKIENNRLITLRRYASPVSDSIEFADYEVSEKAAQKGEKTSTLSSTDGTTLQGRDSEGPWTPLATAVTYFGKDTGNDLSKILNFSAKYNWKELKSDTNPIEISSTQNDAGAGLVSDSFSGISSGLGVIAKFMGILGDVQNGKTLNLDSARGLPPDPYKDGPYNNRILGPVNVIMNTYARERGLTFEHKGLSLNFEYIARPIAGINNKAVLMDLLANILIMCYSSGSWFGGMYRYSPSGTPAMYPWKYGDVMNRMHNGQIFGKNGAISTLTTRVFSDSKGLLGTFIPDITKMISNLVSGAVDAIKGLFGNDDAKKKSADEFSAALSTGSAKTIQKLIAAKATKGTSIPYIHGKRALLTGMPVGDWHLTIGNPLNPIAMIGNLIVTNLNIEFYDELGPDDFPIGFKAKIDLAHGLGRDRDAIESMFNRGCGRIYTLSKDFRSSADHETRVDKYTGKGDAADGDRKKYEEVRLTYYGGGSRFIAGREVSDLKNKGSIYTGDVKKYNFLKPTHVQNGYTLANYMVNPWQMAMNL